MGRKRPFPVKVIADHDGFLGLIFMGRLRSGRHIGRAAGKFGEPFAEFFRRVTGQRESGVERQNKRGLHIAFACRVELRHKKVFHRHGVAGCAGELKLHFAAFLGDVTAGEFHLFGATFSRRSRCPTCGRRRWRRTGGWKAPAPGRTSPCAPFPKAR
jgi:hypothetical protein